MSPRDPADADPRLPSHLIAILDGVEDREVVDQINRVVRGGRVRVMVVTSGSAPIWWGALLEADAVDVVTGATSVVGLGELVEVFVAGGSSMEPEGRLALQDSWMQALAMRRQLQALMATLSPQQRRVLELLAAGRRVSEVGDVMGVARGTVRSHVKALRAKLGARNQLEAVAMYRRASEPVDGRDLVPHPRAVKDDSGAILQR